MRTLAARDVRKTVLSKRAKAEIGRALERREGFQKQGLPVMAQGALDTRITVVVKMSVAGCGCRAVGVSCKRGDELAKEWREARELAGVDA